MRLGQIIQEENLVDFEKAIRIVSFLQSVDLDKLMFKDTKYGVVYYVTYYEKGFVYIEPNFYRGEPEGVQLRIPIKDLADYEVIPE